MCEVEEDEKADFLNRGERELEYATNTHEILLFVLRCSFLAIARYLSDEGMGANTDFDSRVFGMTSVALNA